VANHHHTKNGSKRAIANQHGHKKQLKTSGILLTYNLTAILVVSGCDGYSASFATQLHLSKG